MLQEILIGIIGLGAGAFAAWILVQRSRKAAAGNQEQNWLGLVQTLQSHLDRVTERVDRRLQENISAMNESKSFLASRVSATERSVQQVSAYLGKLEQATTTLQRTNEEIASFQKMLRSPKIRGSFGEVLLGNLLADVLPADRYGLQYTFAQSGEIADAIIRLQDGYIVAIDAKFPLANYQHWHAEENEDHKIILHKSFIRDVKKHIQDIGKKYIVPREKTLEYAFMYIPLEAVYYETMVHDSQGETLWDFSLKYRVVPVSPNSFLAYLQTILVGLRGMKIQEQAKEILASLGQLRHDVVNFNKEFAMVGTHLTNAKNRYEDSARRFDRLSGRLENIEGTSESSLPNAAAPAPISENVRVRAKTPSLPS